MSDLPTAVAGIGTGEHAPTTTDSCACGFSKQQHLILGSPSCPRRCNEPGCSNPCAKRDERHFRVTCERHRQTSRRDRECRDDSTMNIACDREIFGGWVHLIRNYNFAVPARVCALWDAGCQSLLSCDFATLARHLLDLEKTEKTKAAAKGMEFKRTDFHLGHEVPLSYGYRTPDGYLAVRHERWNYRNIILQPARENLKQSNKLKKSSAADHHVAKRQKTSAL